MVAWVQRLGKVSAAVEQGGVSLAASTEQGGISENMGNKIIIDGKEYELSAELVEKIKAEVAAQEKKESPFERTEPRLPYWYITSNGGVDFSTSAANSKLADYRFFAGNYCTDKAIMEQRALHETLNRLLWRYSETHGGDAPWDMGGHSHYYIRHWWEGDFKVFSCGDAKMNGVVFFADHDAAEAAIDEVVKPFMAAHPEFVW